VTAVTWQQTPDRRTWRAALGYVVLTVTKLTSGAYRADVEGVTERSPEFRTRTAAQAWAEERSKAA
jgi:hypothetical protein